MKILSSNILRSATLAVSSSSDLFPVSNLYNKRRVKQLRFTGAVNEYVVINKAGMSFNAVVIDNHNLTDLATVKVQANSSDSWGSPPVDETLTVRETMAFIWANSQVYDYVRILFQDPTNLEEIQVGMIFLDDGDSFDITLGWTENREINGKAAYRVASGQFLPLDQSDKEKADQISIDTFGTIQLSETRQQFGTAWPVYAIIDEDDLSFLPIYSIWQGAFSFTRITGPAGEWDGAFNFEEVN